MAARAPVPQGRLAAAMLAGALVLVEFLAGMQRYLSQTAIAAGVVGLLATTLAADGPSAAFVGLLVAAAMTGAGMGMLYPDLLGRCLAHPDADDGISEDRMAAAVVVAESVGLAVATTAAYAWLGTGLALADAPLLRAQVLYAVLTALAVLMVVRLALAGRVGAARTSAAA